MFFELTPVFQPSLGLTIWSVFVVFQIFFVTLALVQMLMVNYKEKQVFSSLDFFLVLFVPIVGFVFVAIKFFNWKKNTSKVYDEFA